MRRPRLFEFEDLPWFPRLLRRYMTDYLEFVAGLTTLPFEGFAEKLKLAMDAAHENTIVDLCSGSAGPIPQILRVLREKQNAAPKAILTDLYPNRVAFERMTRKSPQISYREESVDALRISEELRGFRTLFNAFHHFPPEAAKKLLEKAARSRQGIAIYEIVGRTPFEILGVLSLIIGMPIFTPFIRPFRFTRLLFTYLIPLVPFFTLWDGLVSCLRVYSAKEMKEMTDGVAIDNYSWEVGTLPFGKAPGRATYLIGLPGPLPR